jgi:hypothetical protein
MSLIPFTVALFGGQVVIPPASYNPAFSGSLGTGVSAGGVVRVYAMAGDDDGGIWVGGDATTYDGNTVDSAFKINNDGSVGTVCNTSSQNVRAIHVDDTYVYVGYSSSPWFEVFDKATGTLQSGYPTFNDQVRDIKQQSNGNIIVAGNFTTPHQNFTAIDPSTKSLPSGFNTHTFTILTAYSGEPRFLLVDSDDKILMGGPFYQVDGTNSVHSGFRMNSDGSFDSSFSATELYRVTNNIVAGGPYISYREVTFKGRKQYLAFGAFFSTWDGAQYSDNYNFALLEDDGVLDSSWQRLTNETGTSANALCVNNDTGHFYIQYGGSNQQYFNGITTNNSNRTFLKFDLNNVYVGDGNWMTNNVDASNDPIYCMYSQEEWGRAPGSPILLGGHSNFTTYNSVSGIGSIAAVESTQGALLTR